MSRHGRKACPVALTRSFASALLLLSALTALALTSLPRAAAANDDLPALCASLGNDDTLRDYQPSLRGGTVKAFRAMFPGAKMPPDDAILQAQAKFRCMNGKAHVCFVGANLPCGKLNTSRQNEGAENFCRSDPEADFVPMAATGHDSVYSYRCHDGKAEVLRATYELDERGFAKSLWMALPEGP
ncbi:MAG TPA: hypothetical protein VG124_07845 [Beijerinckiaceae bacterium]|jgi:hypothetical protein|nr:hypothetical protein [Beijerinckiaceae bacterium]